MARNPSHFPWAAWWHSWTFPFGFSQMQFISILHSWEKSQHVQSLTYSTASTPPPMVTVSYCNALNSCRKWQALMRKDGPGLQLWNCSIWPTMHEGLSCKDVNLCQIRWVEALYEGNYCVKYIKKEWLSSISWIRTSLPCSGLRGVKHWRQLGTI